MNKNEYVCICHTVSLGKLQSYLNRENPKVASQLSRCLDSGTSCGWCIPYLNQLFNKHKCGDLVNLEIDAKLYLEQRRAFNKQKHTKNNKDAWRTSNTHSRDAFEWTWETYILERGSFRVSSVSSLLCDSNTRIPFIADFIQSWWVQTALNQTQRRLRCTAWH